MLKLQLKIFHLNSIGLLKVNSYHKSGGVSSVRTLGQCKAGYAVATVETIETSYFMSKGGSVKQFSPQQIIDCSSNSGNKGCDSGDVINSISYLKSAGVGFESSYPFKQTQETCKYEQAMKIWEIGQCVKVTSDKELNLKGAVKYQPVAASINADKIKSYKSGVYSPGLFSSCKTSPNHWVTIVGYGVQDSQNFWKVKNSWGTSWGVNGYLFISRKGDGEGVCGIQH